MIYKLQYPLGWVLTLLTAVMPSSVINCLNKKEDICKAINYAYDSKIHYNDDFYNPYYKKGTAENIVKVLESSSLENILLKRFHDL